MSSPETSFTTTSSNMQDTVLNNFAKASTAQKSVSEKTATSDFHHKKFEDHPKCTPKTGLKPVSLLSGVKLGNIIVIGDSTKKNRDVSTYIKHKTNSNSSPPLVIEVEDSPVTNLKTYAVPNLNVTSSSESSPDLFISDPIEESVDCELKCTNSSSKHDLFDQSDITETALCDNSYVELDRKETTEDVKNTEHNSPTKKNKGQEIARCQKLTKWKNLPASPTENRMNNTDNLVQAHNSPAKVTSESHSYILDPSIDVPSNKEEDNICKF